MKPSQPAPDLRQRHRESGLAGGLFRLRPALLLGLVATLIACEPAFAGTAAKDGSVIRWTGDADRDYAQAMVYADAVVVTEQGVTTGAGCTSDGERHVRSVRDHCGRARRGNGK
jgi:hypothetical protein